MARLDIERQNRLEPKRIRYAVDQLKKLGKEITHQDDREVIFKHNEEDIRIFPYSGWYSGKGVGSGRGIKKLLRLLNK